MSIKSPVTGSNNVSFVKKISSSIIVDEYKKLDIDVERFFIDKDSVSIYKCLDTGYLFYHPLDLTGDNLLYQKLEKFPWYYMDWKWEHEVASKFVKENDRILEIGCAKGSFLKKMKESGAIVEGLEMNPGALDKCTQKGLLASDVSIEKFSIDKKNLYDVVCSFQVMEHVEGVRDFLQSSISILKPGGLMIVSVPNNDSLIFRSNDVSLNMPPHHMGLWNLNSLIKLQKYFNIKVESVHIEPLQKYHAGYAMKIANENVLSKLYKKLGFLPRFLLPTIERFTYIGVSAVIEFMIGHSILVVFKKDYE